MPATVLVAPGAELQLNVPEEGTTIEAAWNGGALLPVESPLRAPESGSHWLAVASRDRTGKPSAVRWTRIQVDNQPPEVRLTTEPPPVVDDNETLWIPPNTFAVAAADDDLAGLEQLEIHLDGSVEGGDQPSFRRSLPAHGGPVQPMARAIDRVGHEAEASLRLQVDAAPPKGEFHITGPHIVADPHILAPNSRIEARITDDESGLAGWTPWVDGQETTAELLTGPWNPGEHRVEALATDRVGNERRIGPLHFIVDGAGPILDWRLLGESVIDARGQRVYKPPVELEAAAEDAPAGLASFELSTDGQPFTSLESFDGPILLHQESVVLRATDRLGQVTTQTATWRLDGDAPEFRLRVGDSDLAPGHLTIQAGERLLPIVHSEMAGVRQATYHFVRGFPLRKVDSESRQLPEAFSFSSPGNWRLVIDAVDQLGNASSSQWDITVLEGED